MVLSADSAPAGTAPSAAAELAERTAGAHALAAVKRKKARVEDRRKLTRAAFASD
jgi:hypothetical protein